MGVSTNGNAGIPIAVQQKICELLAKEISGVSSEAEITMWHAHPVWLLVENPIVPVVLTDRTGFPRGRT